MTLLLLQAAFAGEKVKVKGYFKKDGTYVAPHYRTAPDRSTGNNWSTKGNYNPYTGEVGTKDPAGASYQNTRPSYQEMLLGAMDDLGKNALEIGQAMRQARLDSMQFVMDSIQIEMQKIRLAEVSPPTPAEEREELYRRHVQRMETDPIYREWVAATPAPPAVVKHAPVAPAPATKQSMSSADWAILGGLGFAILIAVGASGN